MTLGLLTDRKAHTLNRVTKNMGMPYTQFWTYYDILLITDRMITAQYFSAFWNNKIMPPFSDIYVSISSVFSEMKTRFEV